MKADVKAITKAVLAAIGGEVKSSVSAILPSISNATVEAYKGKNSGRVSLRVTSKTHATKLPNGSTKPLEIFVSNIFNGDGSQRSKADRLLTVANLRQEAEFMLSVASELQAQYSAE